MFEEKLVDGIVYFPVEVQGSKSQSVQGQVATKRWTSRERILRGFKNSARLLIPIILLMVPFAIIEPFVFLIWGSVALGVIFLIAGPVLFEKYRSEAISFFRVEAVCPECKGKGPLRPFVHTRFSAQMKVLCPDCGETLTAFVKESELNG